MNSSNKPSKAFIFKETMPTLLIFPLYPIIIIFLLLLSNPIPLLSSARVHSYSCRSYCGNITIDYPFAIQYGCGHPGFRDLLFCINDVLMFHVSSGSYRVLDIDYAYQALTLHDPHMPNCDRIVLGGRGNGFSVEPWRRPYMNPAADNVFMLIGCSAQSPLFQGNRVFGWSNGYFSPQTIYEVSFILVLKLFLFYFSL